MLGVTAAVAFDSPPTAQQPPDPLAQDIHKRDFEKVAEGRPAEAGATFQPVERDLREAQQLLQLSRLEGRDPLQDAVAGRLALDRLDAIADCDSNTPESTWADRLRRELRERFNEIAPTNFSLAESGNES